MRDPILVLAVAIAMSSASYADFTIRIPAVSLTTAIADSSNPRGVRGISGISQVLQGATGTSSLSLFGSGADSGAVRLNYDIGNGPKPYGAAVGLVVPLDPTWSSHDLSMATAISFLIRSDDPGTSVNFLVGSALNEQFGNPDVALQTNVDSVGTPLASLRLTSGWTKVILRTDTDLRVSPWYTMGKEGATDEIALNSMWSGAIAPGLNIGTAVKNLQFLSNWKWTGAGTAMSNGKGSIVLKDIKIEGANRYDWKPSTNCTGKSFSLDHFGPVDLGYENSVGGYWSVYTDSTSTTRNDSSIGASTIQSLTEMKVWGTWPATTSLPVIRSTLEKNAPNYHANAGWVGIRRGFAACGEYTIPVAFPALKAISFDLSVGKQIADSLDWDAINVPYISLKVSQGWNSWGEPFQVKIPIENIDGSNLCIDFDSFKQPTEQTDAYGSYVWYHDPIEQLDWEIKIANQGDADIHTSGPNALAIGNIRLFGLDSAAAIQAAKLYVWQVSGCWPDGVNGHALRPGRLVATYRDHPLLSYRLAGSTVKVEIIRLNGVKVASFDAPAVASDLVVPVTLARGGYLVTVRGGKGFLTAPLVIAR